MVCLKKLSEEMMISEEIMISKEIMISEEMMMMMMMTRVVFRAGGAPPAQW